MTIQNGSTTTIGNVGRAIASRIRGSKSRMEGTTTEIGQDTNKVKTMDNWKKFQRMEQIPSLKDFMHTQKVKKQYRNFLRATKNITDPVFYNQAKHEIRQMYASVKNDSDSLSISMAFQEGERKLKEFKSMVGYKESQQQGKNTMDDDSWLNTKDPDDVRGRVGTYWPWQRGE